MQESNETTDVKRLQHMLAWRKRHIAALEQELQGHRERVALCDALMAYVLFRGSQKMGDVQGILIEREPLRDFLMRFESSVQQNEKGYLLTFAERQEAEHGAPCAEK